MDVLVRTENSELIRQFQAEAPVNVLGLAKAMGLRVFSEPFSENISGKLYRDPESTAGWSISVQASEVLVRQRFTVAHELGHFMLHRDSISGNLEDDTFYRSGLPHWQETEANSFAADTLMPWSLIQKLTERGVRTPDKFAEALQVSLVAMKIRLEIPT